MRSRVDPETATSFGAVFFGAVVLAVMAGCGGRGSADRAAEPQATVERAATAETPRPETDPPRQAAAAKPAAAGRPRETTFDDIKLDMEKGAPFSRDLLPKRVTSLESERIRIRGYILPSFQQTGLTQFVLVRDNMECCFGPGAALHDCIVVRMLPGRTADFSVRPVAVAGTFRVEELLGPDGKHLAIYAMEGEEVR